MVYLVSRPFMRCRRPGPPLAPRTAPYPSQPACSARTPTSSGPTDSRKNKINSTVKYIRDSDPCLFTGIRILCYILLAIKVLFHNFPALCVRTHNSALLLYHTRKSTHTVTHLDDGPCSRLGCDGEAEHDPLGGAVAPVREHAHAHPVTLGGGAEPGLHVVAGRLNSR